MDCVCPKRHAKFSLCAAGAGKRYFNSLLHAHQMVEKQAVQLEKHLQNLFALLQTWKTSFCEAGVMLKRAWACSGLLWACSGLQACSGLYSKYVPIQANMGLHWSTLGRLSCQSTHLPSFIISLVVLLQGISDAKRAK